MSLTNPKKVVTEERLAGFYQSILPYLGGMPDVCGGGFAPIGTIIAFMGTTAPQDYLACDGTVHNIADYPRLAQFFTDQFGSANYFGGNGTTTFAVPDLRGEFLRGTGTNGHENQGSGANVGVHQNGTVQPAFALSSDQKELFTGYNTYGDVSVVGYDARESTNTTKRFVISGSNSTTETSARKFTSRPTNTSILWCIKAVEPGEVYSTSERIVGTWIDGKPIYQKTFKYTTEIEISDTPTQTNIADISSLSIDTIVEPINGCCEWGNTINALPLTFISVSSTIHADFVTNSDLSAIVFRAYRNSGTTAINNLIATIRYTKTTD